jgi:replicative DNA helicase
MSSANPEFLLISKILETGDLKQVMEAGIEPHHFVDELCADHYSFLVDYYLDPAHGSRSVPTEEIFKVRFPKDNIATVHERTGLKELIVQTQRMQLSVACGQLADEVAEGAENGKPKQALEIAISSATSLLSRSHDTKDIRIADHANKIIDDYKGAKEGKMRGIPWPWKRLNELTRGIEPGNLVLYYGRPKQMKSWVACYQAAHFYQTNMRGGKVLFVSLEMPAELVARRLAAAIARVNYEKFMQGKLNKDEEIAFTQNLNELSQQESADMYEGRKKELIITVPENDMSVIEIENKVEEYDPDLVVIDGTYLLSDARTRRSGVDWKILANVSTDLKRLAQRKKVPIVGVHQANRKSDEEADDLSDIAFTDNYARDADVLIKCIHMEDYNEKSTLALLFSGAREFKMAGFYIHGKPAENFEYINDFRSREELLSKIKNSKKSHSKAGSTPTTLPDIPDVATGKDLYAGRIGRGNAS